MQGILAGLRIVEMGTYIAAPSLGMHFAQLGAEVIRIDPINGAPDMTRSPCHGGVSLYWQGLNKGKRSVTLDLKSAEGREIAIALATAPGEGGGIFVTNMRGRAGLSHEELAQRRPDMISVLVTGWSDGRPAVDQTVNAALGVPLATGPVRDDDSPVNHAVPAWDLLTGAYGAFVLLAAERNRSRTGAGSEIVLPLSDMAMSGLSAIGMVAEASLIGDRAPVGNDVFGAFGRDFATADGDRIMLVAITARQWTGLVSAIDLDDEIAGLEQRLLVDFAAQEEQRFVHRDQLNALIGTAIRQRTLSDLASLFDRVGVCWSRYRRLSDALGDPVPDVLCTTEHPGSGEYPTAGPAAQVRGVARAAPSPAPQPGEDTEDVLSGILKMTDQDIARLRRSGIVGQRAQAR